MLYQKPAIVELSFESAERKVTEILFPNIVKIQFHNGHVSTQRAKDGKSLWILLLQDGDAIIVRATITLDKHLLWPSYHGVVSDPHQIVLLYHHQRCLDFGPVLITIIKNVVEIFG